MANLRTAKMRLRESEKTFVCLIPMPSGEDKVYESEEHGIAPILIKLEIRKKYFKDAYVADRVVGRAAAMLLVASGVRGIYAETMSEEAKKYLENVMYDRSMGRNTYRLVEFEARKTVPFIKNEAMTGLCPFEKAVQNLEKAEDAYDILNGSRMK